MLKLKRFFGELSIELLAQGKMLVGYLLVANPWLTNYPTLMAAIESFVANPSEENAALVLGQAILAFGAAHRVVKILIAVLKKVQEQ